MPLSRLSEQTCGCKNKESPRKEAGIDQLNLALFPPLLSQKVLFGLYHSFKQHLLSPYYAPGTAPRVNETDDSSVLREPTFKGAGGQTKNKETRKAVLR